jgi:DnaJ-class molecular chaperone
MPVIDCPKCDGRGGWNDIDGMWVECRECDGTGYVDSDEDRDDDIDPDDCGGRHSAVSHAR